MYGSVLNTKIFQFFFIIASDRYCKNLITPIGWEKYFASYFRTRVTLEQSEKENQNLCYFLCIQMCPRLREQRTENGNDPIYVKMKFFILYNWFNFVTTIINMCVLWNVVHAWNITYVTNITHVTFVTIVTSMALVRNVARETNITNVTYRRMWRMRRVFNHNWV